MPRYKYTAKDNTGKTVHGFAEAADENALYTQLRGDGLYLMKQSLAKDGTKLTSRRLPIAAVSYFSRELGTLLSAGVPLVRSLNILANEEDVKPAVRQVYTNMQQDIRKGLSLSESMENRGDAFPPLLIGMIRSAEGTGSIDKAALRMGTHYEKEHRMNQQIINTLTYPIILAIMTVGVVAFLLAYVVPQFEPMFAQMESLPPLTVALFALSDLIKYHWPLLLGGIAVVVLGVRALLQVPAVRLQFDRFKLHMPVLGKMRRKIYTARFARTLSNLYSSGVPIVVALQSGKDTVGNTYIASQFDDILGDVRSGKSLSEAIGQVDGFERKLTSTILVGEETGRLDSMLSSISDDLDYESEIASKRMMTMLEPLMIIIMAIIVCIVIIAIILPIYQSYSTIGSSVSSY